MKPSINHFMQWLMRLPFVMLLSACMGWLGLILMYFDSGYFPAYDDFWTRYVVMASVLIWGTLSYCLFNRSLQTWLAWGCLSPILGGLLVAPPASFSFIVAKGYVAFPVGIATGAMMWWMVNLFKSSIETSVREKTSDAK